MTPQPPVGDRDRPEVRRRRGANDLAPCGLPVEDATCVDGRHDAGDAQQPEVRVDADSPPTGLDWPPDRLPGWSPLCPTMCATGFGAAAVIRPTQVGRDSHLSVPLLPD
jgi:hypothetical protein